MNKFLFLLPRLPLIFPSPSHWTTPDTNVSMQRGSESYECLLFYSLHYPTLCKSCCCFLLSPLEIPCFNFPGLKYLFTGLSFFLTTLKPASSPSNSVKMQWLNVTSQPANDHGHWIMTYFQVTAQAASLIL